MGNNREAIWNPYRKSDADDSQGESDSWLMSYGDMMTLLLVFFVLIAAISEIDPVRMQMVTQSMRNAMGQEQFVPTLKEIQEEMSQSVYDLNIDDMVSVERNRHGVQLLLNGESFFRPGSADLLPNTETFLNEVVWQIMKTPYLVSVEGHTDNIPISTPRYPSNWELSAARAASVVRYFEANDLPRSRFRIVGFADAQPYDPALGNSTAAARARNRRIVITFLNEFAPRETLGPEWEDFDFTF